MISKESVIKRRSIRKYEMKPLSDEILRTLDEFIASTELPFEGNFGFKT